MPACNQQCDSRYCASEPQAHEAMAKYPEPAKRYASESQHIREAIKTLVHADASFTQLHWVEILPLMKKFGDDIASMHHISFGDLAAPAEVLEEMLMSFNRGIGCLGQIIWVPDAPHVQEYRERTVQMHPHLTHFISSGQLTPHLPMHFQNLRSQVSGPLAPTPAPRVNITIPKRELPPGRMKRSSSHMQRSPCVSPPIAAGNTSVGSQLGLGMVPASSQSPTMPTGAAAKTAAYPSASESECTSIPRRRREPDACSMCKLRKTGCGGRFKHCLKNPANIKSSTATAIRRERPPMQLNQMTQPAFNGEFSQQMPPSGQSLPAVEDSYRTGFEGTTPLDGVASPAIGTAFCLQHAHTFPTTTPADALDGTNIFDTPAPFSTEWFDDIGYRADCALDQEYRSGMSSPC